MLSLNRKTDYALIALAYMADRSGQWVSAREIAQSAQVPLALLMNVLKTLHQSHILCSTRGTRGGYQITADLERLSLFDLTRVVARVEPDAGGAGEPECCGRYKIDTSGMHGPVHAFHHKLRRFLKAVKLSDLVLPGRRIDVPVESVSSNGRSRGKTKPTNPLANPLETTLPRKPLATAALT
jgi:Rrf2 family protein